MTKNDTTKSIDFSCILVVVFTVLGNGAFAQNWTSVAPLPNNFRSDHSFGFSIGEIGYLVAGQTESGYSNAFFSYAPESDTWSELQNFPGDARGYAIGDEWNGKAWFGFGQGPNGFLNDLWVFDPASGIWEEKASCPCQARMHPAFVAIDDHIYMGLGNSAAGDLDDWWEYDMTSDTWAEKPSFPDDQRHHPYQFGIDSQVYVGFGHHNTEIYNEWYRYTPSDETWTEMTSLPDQGRVAGAQFSHEGKGYALSGDGEGHTSMPTGEFWQFDPVNNSWMQWPAHPGMSRWAPASFVINNEVYLINGKSLDPGTFDFMETNWKLPMAPTLTSDAGIDGYLGETVVCGQDPVNVSTSLTNWGSDVLNTLQLELLVDGEVVLEQTWEGSLNSYESEIVEFGSYAFSTATPVAIEIATPDLNPSNNTVNASITASPEGTTEWLITLNTDNWGNETSWEIRDQNGILVQLSSPDVYANQTEYEIEVSLPALGCYVFKLMDEYGDGMSGSGFGGTDGSCSIEALDNNGEPIGLIFDYDGSFPFDEITQKVNVNSNTSLGINANTQAQITTAYPNPFCDFLTLDILGSLGVENSILSVYNGRGKLMHRSEIASRRTNSLLYLDTHSWSSGLYLIQIDFEGESISQTQRVVKSEY